MESFTFNERHRIIICKTCNQAVTARQFQRHIQDTKQHQADFPKGEARRRIVEAFSTKATVDIRDLVILSTVVESIDGLDVFVDGLKCNFPESDCQFVTRQTKWMKRHAQEKHDWANPRSRGRPTKSEREQEAANRPWTPDVKCQQFFKTGPKSQLFEVQLVGDDEQQSPLLRRAGTHESDWRRRMEQDRQRTKEIMEKVAREEKDLVHKSAKGEITPWLKRTDWPRFLEGQRRRRLIPLVAKPDRDAEPELFEIARRFDKIIKVAQQTVISRVSVMVQQEIRRKDINVEAKKPFNAQMEEDSMKRYRGEFKSIIWYILRVWLRQNRAASEASSSEVSGNELSSSGVSDETGSENGDEDRPRRQQDPPRQRPLPEKLPQFEMSTKQEDLTSWLMAKIRECVGEEEIVEVPEAEDEEVQTGRLDRVNRILIRWCIELFNTELGGSIGTDFNSPVIAALAIMAIRSNGAWASPLSYTPKLSAIVKMVQMMVVQQAWEANNDGGKDGPSVLRQTRNMVEGFMTTHEPTPMKWIHDVRRYGMTIRMRSTSAGTVRWIGERLQYQNIEFTMTQFRSMLHGLVDKAHRTLMEDVFCFVDDDEQRESLPVIPWDTLHDNLAEDEPGWCFIDDARNEWPVDGKSWLSDRIWDDEHLRHAFIRRDEVVDGEEQGRPSHPWKKVRVERWMRYVAEFKESLLLLMHITGGGPARTPEILSIRYRNTANGGLRNILVHHETMIFVTEYHKGFGFSGEAKLIYRYLPREVGELLVWYLWLVLPLQHAFEVMVRKEKGTKPQLWSSQGDVDGRKWTGERMKGLMKRETGEGMGVVLNIADYRQCAAAIVDKYIGRQEGFEWETEAGMEAEEEDEGCWWDTDDRPEHLQFAHSSHEAMIGYAREWDATGAATVGMQSRWMKVSQAWGRLWGFPSLMGSDGERGTEIGGTRKKGGLEAGWEEEERKVKMRRWQAMKQVNIHTALERMMGKGVEFRAVQEATIQAIVGGKSRIMAVMGTGSGKSLTFMLPATFEKAGTTIVVVPMTSLRADMKRRCDELRIECVEWDSRRPPEKASLVLVTPESVPKKGFMNFLNRLRGMHRLDRVVIDECHMVLDSSEEFRPSLLGLREVMTFGCPVVMLTATMPPSEEGEFIKRMGLEEFDVAAFRAKTVRKNIAYEVREYDGSDESAVEEIQARQKELEESGGKVIVYARTRDRVEQLAEAIGCSAFHAKKEDKEKRRILREFTEGKTNVVVATNALGMGIDIPDVRTVLHVDAPDSLRYYGQESGRAGRDGRKSRAVILKVKKQAGRYDGRDMFARATKKKAGHEEMEMFTAGEVCRRVVLDEYLDGTTGREGCGGDGGEKEELCDVCRERQTTDEAAEAAVNASVAVVRVEEEEQAAGRKRYNAEQWDLQRLRQQSQTRVIEAAGFEGRLRVAVQEWNMRCAVCKIRGRPDRGLGHPTSKCAYVPVEVKEEIARMRRPRAVGGFESEKYGGCVGCGLPQGICERWEETAEGFRMVGGRQCQARYVLIDVVVAMICAGGKDVKEVTDLMDWMEDEDIDVTNGVKRNEFWGKGMRVGSIETNRLAVIFERLTRAFKEGVGEF